MTGSTQQAVRFYRTINVVGWRFSFLGPSANWKFGALHPAPRASTCQSICGPVDLF